MEPRFTPDSQTITGCRLVDGTGAPARRADIEIRAGRIAAITDRTGTGDLVVAPGFIDIHSHSDLTVLSAPNTPSAVQQGITTTVVGNCGLGVYPNPVEEAEHLRLRQAVAYCDVDPAVEWTWTDYHSYADRVRSASPAINVGVLTGHLPLHAAAVGHARVDPTAAQLRTMCQLLDDALAGGSLGLSTGLVYSPLTQVGEPELTALAEVVSARNALFAWHMADYGAGLQQSLGMVIKIARATGARMQISHFSSNGERYWPHFGPGLATIEQARAVGVDIAADIYPYAAGNCPLSQLLPAWVTDAGLGHARASLRDPQLRQQIAAHLDSYPVPWDKINISRAPGADGDLTGLTVAQAAGVRDRPGTELVMDLLAEHLNEIIVTIHGKTTEHVARLFASQVGLVASDGLALDPDGPTGVGAPHPRSYGCFPRLLQDFVGAGRLTLEQAVHKATAYPAQRIGITDRGTVAVGSWADLVIFDPATVADRASYTEPARFPAGIDSVIVNGRTVLGRGTPTDARPGVVVERATGSRSSSTRPTC